MIMEICDFLEDDSIQRRIEQRRKLMEDYERSHEKSKSTVEMLKDKKSEILESRIRYLSTYDEELYLYIRELEKRESESSSDLESLKKEYNRVRGEMDQIGLGQSKLVDLGELKNKYLKIREELKNMINLLEQFTDL